MATRVRDRSIQLKNTRKALSARREPYWRQLNPGRYLGYRKTETGSETWIARWTDEEGRFKYESLGPLSAFTWSEAKASAEEWFDLCEVGIVRAGTVEEACRNYVDNRRVEISDNNANDAEKRFKAHVYGTPFAKIRLNKLRTKQIERWRNDLLAGSTPEHTKRTFKILRAALNYAFRSGEIRSDAEWKRVSLTVKGDTQHVNELDFYWPVEQRRAYLKKCPADLRDFLTALSLTGARPQEIAAAKVEDFERFSRKLILRHRKGYQSRLKARDFSLANDATFDFFVRMAADKLPQAPLLTRSNREGWYSAKGNGAWVAQVKRIRRAHKFDDRLTAYHFRHWAITDWLNLGIVAANVATLAGTSIEMIDQYYRKHVKAHVDDQLAGVETVL
ncbi:MAG: site-specific integrase [Gammaproteobacteria bacterium]|nr:MAG: site-specific integrase [Gammaproteobacteria bacterium]